MTDLDNLTKIIHDETCRAGGMCRKPRDIHQGMADPYWIAQAVIAAGWAPRCGDYQCVHADHADHAGGR